MEEKNFTPLLSEEVFKEKLTEFKDGIEEYKKREQKKIDEFTKNGTLCLTDFSGVKKFKSIKLDSANTGEQGKYLTEHLRANLES